VCVYVCVCVCVCVYGHVQSDRITDQLIAYSQSTSYSVDQARGLLKCKQGRHSNSGELWIPLKFLTNICLLLKKTVVYTRSVLKA
jgi:hypothetical protein